MAEITEEELLRRALVIRTDGTRGREEFDFTRAIPEGAVVYPARGRLKCVVKFYVARVDWHGEGDAPVNLRVGCYDEDWASL